MKLEEVHSKTSANTLRPLSVFFFSLKSAILDFADIGAFRELCRHENHHQFGKG